MAEIDVNIARGVQVPDAMKSISGMLNFANQAQQFQSNNQALEKQNIELQKSRQANTERLALQQFMQNPDNWQTNGKIDIGKLNAAIPKIAPYTGHEVLDKFTTINDAQTRANESALKLTQGKREVIGSAIGVLGRAGVADPKVYSQALDDLRTLYKDDADFGRLVDSYKSILGVTQAGPGIPKAAITAAQSLLSPAQQQQTLTPTAGLTNTGGNLAETVTTPAVGGNAPNVQMTGRTQPITLGPGGVEATETGPDGNQYIVTRSPTGAILGTRPLAGGPAGGTGGGPGMPRFSPGDKEAIPALEAERTTARNLLQSAPVAHTTNQGIISELKEVIATGKTGRFLAKASSVIGAIPGNTEAERAASAYDLIGKYTERNALEAAKAMGPGTNAGLEAAIRANGSAGYNPTALMKITKLNDAIVSGAEMYQPGLEKAIAADPQRGVLVKREFDQAWAQNFDPVIMEIANARRAGDTKGLQEIIKSLGGKDSARAKEIIRKAANLEKLSRDGRL